MRMSASTYLQKRHRSTNSAANVYCKADAIDTIFSDTPVVDGGEKAAQLFVGHDTKLVSVHPMKDEDKANILGAFSRLCMLARCTCRIMCQQCCHL